MRNGLVSALLALLGSGVALAQTPLADFNLPPFTGAVKSPTAEAPRDTDARPASPAWRTTAQEPAKTNAGPLDLSAKPEPIKSLPAAGKASTAAPVDEPTCEAGVFADCAKEEKKNCCPPGCGWVSAEYLMWFLKPAPLPGPGSGLPLPGNLNLGRASGVRGMAGIMSPDHRVGLEVGILMLEQRSAGMSQSANGVAPPGITGPANASASVVGSNRLWGGEANITKAGFGAVGKSSSWEVDFLGGFRYLNLSEGLNANAAAAIGAGSSINVGGVTIPGPASAAANANFATQNNFYGPQTGHHDRVPFGPGLCLGHRQSGPGLRT